MAVSDTLQYTGVDEYIDAKVQKAEDILQERDIDIQDRSVLIGYDMNGPLTDRDSSQLQPNEQVTTAVRTVPLDRDDVLGAMISGYDIDTLQYFRDQRLELEDRMEVVGELGSVYTADGDVHQVHPGADEDDIIELKQSLYEAAAQESRKLLEQGNFSTVVGCTRIEGEGTPEDPRGETYLHVDADPDETTEDLWEALRDVDGFSYNRNNGIITYESDHDTTKALSEALRHDHTFLGVRFRELTDGRIGLRRDRTDADIDIEDAHAFIENSLPEGWRTEPNPDWGVDYISTDISPSKERGANSLAQQYFDSGKDEYLIAHVGDKEGDVMDGDNAVFFPQENTPAHRHCEENGIEHVPVRDAWDYSLIMAELLDGDTDA